MRTCKTCQVQKPLTDEFWPIRKDRSGFINYRHTCKPCTNEKLRDYARERCRKAREADGGHATREAVRRWKQAHPEDRVAHREGHIKQRVRAEQRPVWRRPSDIQTFYRTARLLRDAGEDVVVDHVIPLNGELVCGLHVWNNLQFLTRAQNQSKRSLFDPETHREPLPPPRS